VTAGSRHRRSAPPRPGTPTIERHRQVEPLAGRWDELADRTGAAPWLRPGWVTAWWQAFGRGRLELLVALRDGRLAGVVPLERRPGRLTATTNPHTPGFCLLAEDPQVRRALADALMRQRVRRVTLRHLPPEGGGLAESRAAARAAGRLQAARTMLRSPYIPLEGDWPAFQQALGSRRLRGLRRQRRRLENLGKLTLDVQDGRDRLDHLLAEGLEVEVSGWKGERGTAIASRADTRAFYRAVGGWAAERGWLRLAFLRLDDLAIAFDYCMEDGGVHYLLKTGYHQSWREYGPGVLLRYEMLARAYAAGLDRYDLLGTDDPWKAEWTDNTRELISLQGFARSLPGLVDWAAWAHGRPLAKRVLAARPR
jgi:CelD/BcsL family acetyltransferase involved in cellulose biosynthesis